MQEVLEKKSIKNIDFNCDLAQAYGVYKNSQEFELLDYVSSVNISCGFHAGDPVTIKEALLKAKENPEEYKSLTIRVAGYTAYFVELSPDLQDEIIARTEYQV